jgi:hypothetical protein
MPPLAGARPPHFPRKSQSPVERLRRAAPSGRLFFFWQTALCHAFACLFEIACRCGAFRRPSKNATGVTNSWPSERAEHISDWANTGDPTAVEALFRQPRNVRCPISLSRARQDVREFIRRGDHRLHASAIPAGAYLALAALEAPRAPGIRRRKASESGRVAATSTANVRAQMPRTTAGSRGSSVHGLRGPSWRQDRDPIEFSCLTSTPPGVRPDRRVSLSCHPPLL